MKIQCSHAGGLFYTGTKPFRLDVLGSIIFIIIILLICIYLLKVM